MTEDSLKNEIKQLKSELELKNKEITNYCDRIEYLEDSIMEIEENLSKKSKKSPDALLKFQMNELEIKYRDLKNNMGFLRKENTKLKIEIDKIKKKTNNSSSIKIVTRNSLSNEVITSMAKDIVFIENEIKKTNMNKEEIGNRLRKLMKIVRNR